MKLPLDKKLGLQPHYAPGESIPSKPKQAMVVRMSTEALNALQQHPTELDLQFGDNPGLYVSDTFYSMRHLKEDTRHELYLRAASIKKPNAPLMLYANVHGKFTVERQLGDGIEDKIREVTKEANKQRNERQMKYLDSPPSVPNNKKKKEASMFRKPPRASLPQNKVASASSNIGLPRASLPPSVPEHSQSQTPPNDLRTRIIHCLAVKERSLEGLCKAVGASTAEVATILKQVAERAVTIKKDSSSAQQYTLMTASWLEVRPWDWPLLSEQARISMARSGRAALSKLKIPETDKRWSHFVYRDKSNARATSPTKATEKRSVTTSVKDRKAKVKSEDKEIKIKDEGSRVSSAMDKKPKVKAEEKEVKMKDESTRATASTESSSLPSRRIPGSGYRLAKSAQSSHASPRESSSTLSPSHPSQDTPTSQARHVRHNPDAEGNHITPTRTMIDDGSLRRSSTKRTLKEEDTELSEPATKRRRTNEMSVTPPVRDLSLPKKPDVPLPRAQVPSLSVTEPMRRFKKEPSPPPADPVQRKRKTKRREATYTSSEEDEPPRAPAHHLSSSTSSTSSVSEHEQPLPSSRSELRALYQEEYIRSLSLISTLMSQRPAIEAQLQSEDGEMVSAPSSTPHEELMDYDKFISVTRELKATQGLLGRIRAIFEGEDAV